MQGFTFPVAELFLEDVLEKTRYKINSEFDDYRGSSRRRRQQSTKSDPLTEIFEARLAIYFNILFKLQAEQFTFVFRS